MNKKRLFAIVLFIILGLFMFTFANSKNNKDDKKPNGDILTPVNQNNDTTSDNTDTVKQEEVVDTNVILVPTKTTTVLVTPTTNNNNNNNNNEIGDVIVDVNLDNAKQAAIDELDNYKQDYPFSEENQEKVDKIKEDGKDNIINAKTEDEIKKALEDAEKEIDKIADKDLEEAKEKAKEAVKEYADELNFTNDVTDIIDSTKEAIDNAQTKNEIDKIVDEAKDLLENLKELEFSKEKAIEELEKYRNDYIYSEKNKTKHDKIVLNGKNNINDAKTVEEVYAKLNEAEKKIDKLIKKDLKEAKIEAKKDIDDYNINELYNDKNSKKVNNIKAKAKKAIDKAKSRKEINLIVEKAKKDIDKIKKLTDTKFTVIFKGLNGEVLKEQKVLYNTAAIAPVTDDINDRGITYEFKGWDKDFSNIKEKTIVTAKYDITKITATMYALNEGIEIPKNGGNAGTGNYKSIGKIELDINNAKVLNAIGNKTQNITLDEDEIKSLVAQELPSLNKMNYMYKFYVLKFEKNDGFHIDAAIVEDQEQIAQNTVTITYKINENDNATFEDGSTTQVSTEIIKYNVVKLPKVYKNNKEVNVIWTEENTSNVVENNTKYEHSVTLVATVDKTAPVITLNGDTSRSLFETTGIYEEEGYKVTDNYTELANDDVVVTITRDNKEVDKVDYSIPGLYIITYKATDSDGNTTSVKRTIEVKEVVLDHIELSRTSGNYFVGDQDDTNNITVKAFYNDSTRNRVLGEDEYEKDSTFDSSVSGTKAITYSYEGKTATYTYTVTDIEITSITLSSNNDTYYVNDQINSDITLTVTYNDSRKDRTYTSSEYTVDGFDASSVGINKTTNITANDNSEIKATYTYTVEYSDEQLSDLFKNTTSKLHANWYLVSSNLPYIEFKNLPSDAKVVSIRRDDTDNVSLIEDSKTKYYFKHSKEYRSIRHNGNHAIYITYSINNQTYMKMYNESFGYVD